MRRSLLTFALLVAPLTTAQAQETVTIRDIVELSKAGLKEEVLLALIEVHRPVFPLDAVTLKNLKDSGVAPNVIIAMIRSGRELPRAAAAEEPAPAPVQAPAPQVVYVEHERHEEPAPRLRYEERVREVAVPIYVPIYSRPIVRPEPQPAEPVYWGFGGKLRPDAWKTAADVQKDAKVPREPQKK
jgi:hypothetical protein